jgi:hypothetical protein
VALAVVVVDNLLVELEHQDKEIMVALTLAAEQIYVAVQVAVAHQQQEHLIAVVV